jgi:hypothetical protein
MPNAKAVRGLTALRKLRESNCVSSRISHAVLLEGEASSRRFDKSACSLTNGKRFNPSTQIEIVNE